jgi:DNA-binding NarL/FixJ family response regulator
MPTKAVKICSHCGSVLPSTHPALSTDAGLELTDRQRQVIALIAQGLSAKEIAGKLEISSRTAEFHRAAIMERLRIRTTAELTLYAATHKLL